MTHLLLMCHIFSKMLNVLLHFYQEQSILCFCALLQKDRLLFRQYADSLVFLHILSTLNRPQNCQWLLHFQTIFLFFPMFHKEGLLLGFLRLHLEYFLSMYHLEVFVYSNICYTCVHAILQASAHNLPAYRIKSKSL